MAFPTGSEARVACCSAGEPASGSHVTTLVIWPAVVVAIAAGTGCKASRDDTDASPRAFDAAAASAAQPFPHATCTPASVEPKPATPGPPMASGQGACSREAVGRLFGACFQAGGDCVAWKAGNGACARCVFTPEGAPQEGPFLTRDGQRPRVNQRGCLDGLAPGCGSAYEAVTACTHAACDGNLDCAGASAADLSACRQAAMRAPCAPLMQSFSSRCGAGGLTDKRACFPPENSEDALRSFVTALALRTCGPATAQ